MSKAYPEVADGEQAAGEPQGAEVMATFPKREEDDGTRFGQSHELRHPDDMRVRRFGFTLVGRPEGKESLWRRAKATYTQSEALVICDEEDARRKMRGTDG